MNTQLEELPQELRDEASQLLDLLSTCPPEEVALFETIHNFCGGNLEVISRVALAALIIEFVNYERN